MNGWDVSTKNMSLFLLHYYNSTTSGDAQVALNGPAKFTLFALISVVLDVPQKWSNARAHFARPVAQHHWTDRNPVECRHCLHHHQASVSGFGFHKFVIFKENPQSQCQLLDCHERILRHAPIDAPLPVSVHRPLGHQLHQHVPVVASDSTIVVWHPMLVDLHHLHRD